MIRESILTKALANPLLVAVSDTKKSMTYKDLLNLAKNTSWLSNKKVVLLLPKSCDYISLVFSSIINQFTFIPMSTSQPESRNIQILDMLNPDIIVGLTDGLIGKYKISSLNNLIKEEIKVNKVSKYLSYIIFTSGSTGFPKGVEVTNLGLFNVISQQVKIFNLEKSNIFLYVNTVFDASISDILCSFMSNSTLYINDEIRTKFSQFQNFIRINNISYIDLPPSVLSYLDIPSLPSLKTLVAGGEIPNFKEIQKNVKYLDIFNVYGPTEVSICTSIHKCDENFVEALIGNPLENIEYHIINGELYIKGIGLAKGYTDSILSQESFLLMNNERYYKTGDLVEKTENNYLFLGRNDSQIKYKGQLINLEEINKALKSIDGVKDCFCYFDKEIYCFIEGYNDNINLLLKKMLPSYMIPKFYFFLKIFTRNSSNKIDRKAILNQYDFYLYKEMKELVSFPDTVPDKIQGGKTLLTGASGFLGIHLLSELCLKKKISCLIRAKSIEEGLKKIETKAKEFDLYIDFDNIDILLGDCSLPHLGLDINTTKAFSSVIHCAAKVNNMESHQDLFKDNVITTKNILDFCQTGSLKKLDYISTLSVFVSSEYNKPQIFNEKKLSINNRRFTNGYASTKFQSELLVNQYQKSNPHISIYRLGLLTESTKKDFCLKKSFLKRTFSLLENIKTIPNLSHELYIDLTPIDLVSKNLCECFESGKSQIYNVSYNIKLGLKEMIPLNVVKTDNKEWFRNNQRSLLSQFMSGANTETTKYLNMNIFETTFVQDFINDNFKENCHYPNIEETKIKNHYFKIWRNI